MSQKESFSKNIKNNHNNWWWNQRGKLQYDFNREAAKVSAWSSRKIDKYKYLPGEEILPSNQRQIIEQAKFTYYPLGKALQTQTQTIED